MFRQWSKISGTHTRFTENPVFFLSVISSAWNLSLARRIMCVHLKVAGACLPKGHRFQEVCSGALLKKFNKCSWR